VQGHKGALVLLLVIKGGGHARRFHFTKVFHEGSDFSGKSDEVFRITKLIVSNASGGVNRL
jgi:hypothetical protein